MKAAKDFRSIKNLWSDQEAKRWNDFYAERAFDRHGYVEHLLRTYQSYFLAVMDEGLRRYQYRAGAGPIQIVELGCRPGYVMAAIDQIMNSDFWRDALTDRYQDTDLLPYWIPLHRRVTQAPGVGRRAGDPELADGPSSLYGLFMSTLEVGDVFTLEGMQQVKDGITRGLGGPITDYLLHSFGLLEHYPMSSSISLVNYFRRRGVAQVHYVPLIGHITPSLGDERLLDKWEWINTLSPSVWETFNDEKDLVMTFRGQPQETRPIWECVTTDPQT